VLSTAQKLALAAVYLIGFGALALRHVASGNGRPGPVVALLVPVPFCLLLFFWFWSKDQPG